jgi:hypothetical protein
VSNALVGVDNSMVERIIPLIALMRGRNRRIWKSAGAGRYGVVLVAT